MPSLQPSYLPNDDDELMQPPYDDDFESQRDMQLAMMSGQLPPGVVPPSYTSATGPSAVPPSSSALVPPSATPSFLPSGTPPPGPDYGRLSQIWSERPVEQQPKWWQRALGGVAGGLAGYSNAASRTRNPIDIGAMEQNILAPGYNQKLATWQSQAIPAQQQADLAAQQQQAWWKNMGLGSEASLKSAEAQRAQQQAAWFQRREQPEWQIDRVTGRVINKVTGAELPPPESKDDRYSFALAKGASPEEALYYAANGKMPPPTRATAGGKPFEIVPPGGVALDPTGKPVFTNPKSAKEPDPMVDELRQQRLQDQQQKADDSVLSTKTKQEQQVQAQRQRDIQNLLVRTPNAKTEADLYATNSQGTAFVNPDAQRAWQAINQKYAPRLQQIQNNFAASWRRRGHQADDYDIDPNTLQANPRVAPQQQGAAPQQQGAPQGAPAQNGGFSEQQIRQAAIARGQNPDNAVAAARQRHLIP